MKILEADDPFVFFFLNRGGDRYILADVTSGCWSSNSSLIHGGGKFSNSTKTKNKQYRDNNHTAHAHPTKALYTTHMYTQFAMFRQSILSQHVKERLTIDAVCHPSETILVADIM